MSELIKIFKKLNEYFIVNLVWEEVEEILENVQQNKVTPHSNNTDGQLNQAMIKFISIPLVQRAALDDQIASTLMELCATLRNIRSESESSYDNTFDCWDQVVKVAPRDGYLAFIYTLAALIQIDGTSQVYIKLSILAVNAYFLSLTIPGAKGFHIFEEEIIKHCLQVFSLIERIQNPNVLSRMSRNEPIQVWLQFTTLCDDLKLVLRYVHFNDHKEARDVILKKLIDTQYLNHERGYANMYAANLHLKCFEIYEEMINAHNGEPEQTLMKLMNMTVFLHTYPAKPKSNNQTNINSDCEHISDWFIKSISKYPRLLVKVLKFYIECIVTNPHRTWKTEQTQKALEYAAKYDAALFTKCNESCVEFLCEAVYADEVMIRSRAIDLMSKILQLESQVDWQMFRHEVSAIPREIHLIKELIDSLKDQNNNIKLKSVQALHMALTKGSPNTRKILSECLKYTQFCDTNVKLPDEPRVQKNEIRYEKPNSQKAEYSFQGHGIIELAFLNLPSNVFTQIYQSPLSYIRRAGIMFMEQLVKLNPLIIFNTNFVEETSRLVEEPTALVRKQTLLSVDAVLESYPNCFPVIWIWCKVITPMLHDGDHKNIEVAMECFRCRVLMNMKSIEETNKAEHFMPWVIIRTLLSTQSRFYLQNCFHLALQQRIISPQIVGIIESHLLTSNSTEAWIVLNFICDKVKSKEPDALIHHFITLESWNKEQNMLIALEVLANCIKDFSHTALNHAFTHLLTQLKEGKMLPIIIGKAFDFLLLIDNRSQNTGKSKNNTNQNKGNEVVWVTELHQHLEYEILMGINNFPDNRNTFMSHLYAYSEVNLQTRLRPQQTIISFIHKYMDACSKIKENEMHLENERLFNSMILIAGRLALRDGCVASTTCALYANILSNYDRPPVVNTIIVALTDLCKKHTQIVERIVGRVLRKLKSPYEVNRMETFKCFEKLVLQDQLKLRGSLLLALLATLLDESEDIAARAGDFFAEFLSKKNPALFQKCLIECPFVFNEYKNFDGLDSFSEAFIKSPLKGEVQRKCRQQLYGHLMTDMDDINMILYFGQLKLIAEKSKNDPLIKTPEGIALIKDVLYILKRVCQLTKEQKLNTENSETENKQDDDALAEINELTEATADGNNKGATTNKTATAGTGVGRGKRKREITMPEALTLLEKSLIFIPTIYKNIDSYDDSINKSFDDLCKALAKRFTNLVDYAQPAEFWNKYRTAKVATNNKSKKQTKRKTPKKKKRKIKTDTDDEDEDDDEEDDDEFENELDDEFLGPEKKSNQKKCNEDSDSSETEDEPLVKRSKKKGIVCTEPSMDYIFKPNI
ncbi:condensin-2 complex subunit D3-L [Calliphora vicina]|uniref:condensin-2 complex subunit D3-L n=1 Tax=Calliphora vicina TaxID=7373 RepID=UPI00325A5DC8